MKQQKVSLVMITKNCEDVIEKALKSVNSLVDEIVIVDDYSTDKTIKIAKKHEARIFSNTYEGEGQQRLFALKKANNEWILVLDSDEAISIKLKSEIKSILKETYSYSGFIIPYQNYFLGKALRFGGENYKKIRLFKQDKISVDSKDVHAEYHVTSGEIGKLKNKILHYSYRSIPQVFKKFTDYALCEAKQKSANGEKTNLKKMIFYPPHMFWARFIKDKGYKDGFFRVPLDLGFAYMEFLTYFSMIFTKKNKL